MPEILKTPTGTAVPGSGNDQSTPTDALDPTLIPSLTCAWIPDMSQAWDVQYDSQGIASASQTWVASRHASLPVVARQLVSWNRRLFAPYNQLKDAYASSTKFYNPGLVPLSVSLRPMETNNTPAFLQDHMQAPNQLTISSNYCLQADSQVVAACPSGRFPAILTDKYQVGIQWGRDEFTNQFGIYYAKVELQPSIRLESIHGASLGIIPLTSEGEPDINATTAQIKPLTIGFPLREPQNLIRVTYPWVELGDDLSPDDGTIRKAGPLGYMGSNFLAPGNIQLGQFLGTVNSAPFLGYPRGQVLYQSATLEPRISPVTNHRGFSITHEFLVLSSASWNMTRIEGDPDATLTFGEDAEQPQWPYGCIVAVKKAGPEIYLTADKSPIYPYVHKDFSKLLYYGWELAGTAFPTDKG